MSKMGNCNFSEFEKWQKQIEKLSQPSEVEKLMRKCVQEIAMETLRRVIKKTPVAKTIRIKVEQTDELGNKIKYKNGKQKFKSEVIHTGGTLRRGWIATTHAEAEANKDESPGDEKIKSYAYKLRVHKKGETYQAWLVNPVEYASYVEFGHRQTVGRYVPAIGKRLKASWIPGHWMLTISMQEVEARAEKVIDKILQENFDKMFKGD